MGNILDRLRLHLWTAGGLIPLLVLSFQFLRSSWMNNLLGMAGISAFILASVQYVGIIVGLSVALGLSITQNTISCYIKEIRKR